MVSLVTWSIFQDMSLLHLGKKVLYSVDSGSMKKQGTVHVPNLCFEFMEDWVMHQVSMTIVYMSLTVSQYQFTLKQSCSVSNHTW